MDNAIKIIPDLSFSKDNRIVLQLGKFDNGGFVATDMYTKKTGVIGGNDSALLALATQIAELIARGIAGTVQPGKAILLHVQLLPNTLGLTPINLVSDEKTGVLNQLIKLMLFAGSNKELPLKSFVGNPNNADQPLFSPMFGEIDPEMMKNNNPNGYIVLTPEQLQGSQFGNGMGYGNILNFIDTEADVEVKKSGDKVNLTGKNK